MGVSRVRRYGRCRVGGVSFQSLNLPDCFMSRYTPARTIIAANVHMSLSVSSFLGLNRMIQHLDKSPQWLSANRCYQSIG